MSDRDAVERTAIEACLAGGRRLRAAFETGDTTVERFEHDVKSSADRESEAAMLEAVTDRFPTHELDAEESGHHEGSADWRWVVDPLDGTNNFESGLPSFAAAVAVERAGVTELGVAYVPVTDDLYVARRSDGVRYNGRPLARNDPDEGRSRVAVPEATVMSVVGHDVKLHEEHAAVSRVLNEGVEDACKRRLESWSPTVHWGLLARGALDGALCYRPDEEEQLFGELLAGEAGLVIERGEGWYVAGRTPELADSLAGIAADAVGSGTTAAAGAGPNEE